MTAIEPTDGGTFSTYSTFEETKEDTSTCVSQEVPQSDGGGTARIQTEEALIKATSPNLRNIAVQEAVNRAVSILESADYDWYKQEGYLKLIERLAPTHLEFAEELIPLLNDQEKICIAYLTLAKYQNPENGRESLIKAAKAFTSHYSAEAIFKAIDSLFPSGNPMLELFYRQAHAHLKQNIYRPFSFELLLGQLEVRMGYAYVNETVAKLHALEQKFRYQHQWEPKHILILLNLEAQVNSPHVHETLTIARQVAQNQDRGFLEKLLIIEERAPALQKDFEADLTKAMENEVLQEDNYLNLGKAFLPHRIDLAESFLAKMDVDCDTLQLWLEITQLVIEKGTTTREDALSLFTSLVNSQGDLDAEDYGNLFLKAAPIFGPDSVNFLIDRAVQDYLPNGMDFLEDEVKAQGQQFRHYFGKALGLDFDPPPSMDTLPSPFESIRRYHACDLLLPMTQYNHPHSKQLLEKFKEWMEADRLWGDDYNTYALAEVNLALYRS